MKHVPTYGIMAEFASAQDLVTAARDTYEAGYRKIDAYSPFPVEELADAIGFHKNSVPLVTLIGAIVGGLTGYLMQYWMAVVSYPINVGGRPYHSWPSFIVVTFELTILFGGVATLIGMVTLGRLPRFRHTAAYDPRFSNDRFGVAVHCAPDRSASVRQILQTAGADEIKAAP